MNSVYVYSLLKRTVIKSYENVTKGTAKKSSLSDLICFFVLDLILNLTLSQDERLVAVCSKDLTTRIIDVMNEESPIITLGVLPNCMCSLIISLSLQFLLLIDSIKGICFSKKSDKIYSTTRDGLLVCLDIYSNTLIYSVKIFDSMRMTSHMAYITY